MKWFAALVFLVSLSASAGQTDQQRYCYAISDIAVTAIGYRNMGQPPQEAYGYAKHAVKGFHVEDLISDAKLKQVINAVYFDPAWQNVSNSQADAVQILSICMGTTKPFEPLK